MSTNRIKSGGWVDLKKMPKGPNGRNLCRQCNEEIPPGRRRTFCSDDCVDQWSIRTNPAYMRRKVMERDNGVCAVCGLDTEQLRRDHRLAIHGTAHDIEQFVDRVRELGFKPIKYGSNRWSIFGARQSLWDADHIVPVVEGGGECDLGNIRTLCVPCHKRETADLARRRAWKRKFGDAPMIVQQSIDLEAQ